MSFRSTRWFLGIAMGGALSLAANPASAQITPDATLPNNSTVTINGNTFNIDGGITAGRNLFHSFQQFSVPTGNTASFNNAVNIQNIFSRVTGGSPSNIDGIIKAKASANLFLINPNGIIFGPNARLDVGGSFVGTTANAIQFGNQGFFSATNPNNPALLTVNPSALFFNQIAAVSIQNNSVAPAGKDLAGLDALGLRVPDGKSLLLVGGNVNMDGGQLNAYGGRVELGGLAASGNVGLNVDGDKLSLDFPASSTRADIFLTNSAAVYVEAGGGGDIAVNARNLEVTKVSRLSAGIGQGLGNAGAKAGDITLNATGDIKIDGSGITNIVRQQGIGNGGNITLSSNSLSLNNGAQLDASTLGQGNAGNVIVNALDAVSLAGERTTILSTVEAGGVGKGGNIDINAATLSLKDSAQLLTITREASGTQPAGRGHAGNVNVKVSGAVDIAGEKNGFASGISSQVQTGTQGNGGNITIDSGSFSLRDGARLAASTSGQGNAGNVIVKAKDAVSLAGERTAIFSTVEAGGVGNGGTIDIKAATLSLKDGAQLLTITGGASATQPAGRGDAGNVKVTVSGAVDIAGEKNGFPSGIRSQVQTGTQGNGGNITIDSGSFSLRDGAQLIASTSGQGNAGDVKVTVTGAVDIAGEKNGFPSGIGSQVQTGTQGNAGNITIDSGSFSLRDGAQLAASTFGQGNAGNVIVKAKDAVSLAGNAAIFSRVEAGGVGNGGTIDINAATLLLKDGAQLQTFTRGASATQPAGRGNAGDVNVKVSGAVDIAGVNGTFPSTISSEVQTGTEGNGGNITIDSGSFSLRDGARLAASTFGQGNAGNVIVKAKDAVSLAGERTVIFSTVQAGGVGGTIDIKAATLSLKDGAGLNASTLGQGDAGNVRVNAKDAVSLAGNAAILSTVSAGGVGKGGTIDIKAATLSLKDGAQLQTIIRGASATQPAGRGHAGNVNVKVTGAVDIAGEKNGFPSRISSQVQPGTQGNGGNITIDSSSFSLRDGAQLGASTFGQGNAGTIKVNAAQDVTISGKSFTNFTSGLYVDSQSPTGTAGDIIVTSPRVTLDNSGTLNSESASGNGGNINLKSDLLLLRRGAQISTSAGTAQAGGNGGNITINTPNGFIVSVPNENSDITANAFNGSGGVIKINALSIYNFTKRSLSDLKNLLGTEDPIKLNTQQLQTNDITAISLTSPALSGQVDIITSFDPNRGLVELPTYVFDPSNQIAQGCSAFDQPNASDFKVTGRGGLPPSPDEPLSSDAVWEDTRLGATTAQRLDSKTTATKPKSESDIVEIIPATGWVFNGKGEVTLVSNGSSTNNLGTTPATCPAR